MLIRKVWNAILKIYWRCLLFHRWVDQDNLSSMLAVAKKRYKVIDFLLGAFGTEVLR